MKRTISTLAGLLFAAAAVVGLTGPAHAAAVTAPATTDPLSHHGTVTHFWHQRGDGYHWISDGSPHSLPRLSVWRTAYCTHYDDGVCMARIRDFYRGVRHEWRAYSATLWADAAQLPACASPAPAAGEADCAAETWGGVNRVRVGGVDYYVQTSTKPPLSATRPR